MHNSHVILPKFSMLLHLLCFSDTFTPNYHLLLHWVTLTSDSISSISLRYGQFPLCLPPVTCLTLSYFSGLVPPRNHCASTNHMATISSTPHPSLSLLLVEGRAIIPVLAVSDVRKENQESVGLTPAPGSYPPYPAVSPGVSWFSSMEECFETFSQWAEGVCQKAKPNCFYFTVH